MRRAAESTRGWTFPWSAVVYNGISQEDFPVSDDPPASRRWSWRLLFVGRVERRKGVATAVRALNHLPPEATLVIDGPVEPAYMPELQAVIVEEGVQRRVQLRESLRAELRSVYTGADVVVFPSEWAEPFGLVPIEAMACDTPVVATGTGGSREFLVHGVNCLLWERGRPAALAAAVRELADDEDLRATLVTGGRTAARALNTERLADEFERWHAFAAGGFRGDPPPPRTLPFTAG
jgi:D-inositol-3-phosphate glycosyltransferase